MTPSEFRPFPREGQALIVNNVTMHVHDSKTTITKAQWRRTGTRQKHIRNFHTDQLDPKETLPRTLGARTPARPAAVEC